MDIVAPFQSALSIAVICSVVLLIPALVTGLFVSVIQAATQIQDSTLSFVPKMFVVGMTLYFAGTWMFGQVQSYSENLLVSFQTISRAP